MTERAFWLISVAGATAGAGILALVLAACGGGA